MTVCLLFDNYWHETLQTIAIDVEHCCCIYTFIVVYIQFACCIRMALLVCYIFCYELMYFLLIVQN